MNAWGGVWGGDATSAERVRNRVPRFFVRQAGVLPAVSRVHYNTL